MKAIETVYNGYRFRSRLEARWAVFFDTLGVTYEYEPEGYELDDGTRYLPDFYFPEWACFGEVKPVALDIDEFHKTAGLPEPCLLLDGVPKVEKGYYVTGCWGDDDHIKYLSGDEYGRVVLEPSKYQGRLWYLFGEDAADYYMDRSPEIAAKQARFEHGEVPRINGAN